MKKITLLAFILCSFLMAKAGSGDSNKLTLGNRFNISLSLGPGIPSNSFGTPYSYHLSASDTIAGFAHTGFHFDLTAKAYMTSHFGLIMAIGGNLNSFNTNTYNNSITYSEPRTSSTQANSYYCGEYMVGPFLSFPMVGILSNVSFHIAAMYDNITATFPTITTTFSASSTQSAGEATFSANSTRTWGVNLNTGFDDKITKHLFLSLSFSYCFAYVKYSGATYTETLQNGTTLTTTFSSLLTLPLGLIKPTVGIGYIF